MIVDTPALLSAMPPEADRARAEAVTPAEPPLFAGADFARTDVKQAL